MSTVKFTPPWRFLTPNTSASAVTHAGTGVRMEHEGATGEPTVDNAAIMRNAHGFYAVTPDLWLGYFSSTNMAVLALAMTRAVMLADIIERTVGLERATPGPPPPYERVEIP